MNIEKHIPILGQFYRQMIPTVLLVVGIAAIYVYFMLLVDHQKSWAPYFVVLLAVSKTVYFTFITFRQVNRSVERCHTFRELLSIFGVLVVLIIFSFAADYACLNATDPLAFRGLENTAGHGYLQNLFEMFYFSVVTFASVGYGDIVPVSMAAKIISTAEIGQSFVMVIFGLSNINKIHTVSKNNQS